MKLCRMMSVLLVVFGGFASDAAAQNAAARATPPSAIPTVSLANVARQGFWYAGGKYVGELGDDKESTMGGAMYVEVMVPKQIRSPYPIVFIHGAGADRRRRGCRRPTAGRGGPTTSSTWATSST